MYVLKDCSIENLIASGRVLCITCIYMYIFFWLYTGIPPALLQTPG